MLYTNLDSLKKRLWITTTESDSELSLIIERATNIINANLWISLEKRTVTERVDGQWHNKIYLSNKPNLINKITDKKGTDYILDFIDWYIVFLEKKAPKWEKNIIVEYEVWFDIVPADIEEICLDLCFIFSDEMNIIWKYTEKIVDKNIKTKKLGDLMITYFWENEKKFLSSKEALNPAKHIEEILNKYKPFSWLIY